jgi:drug/metabolite transporter (DMT)-like permease
VLGIALALGASVAWGGSDFAAGVATRRRSLLVVLAGSQAVGLVVLVAMVVAGGEPLPPAGAIWPACGAGLVELIGFAALYRGLAVGPMGVVSPLSALGGAVPLAVALAVGDLPGVVPAAGIVLALAGVALVSSERDRGGDPGLSEGVVMGAISALAFGAFFVLTAAATEAGGATWAVTVNRTASVAVLVVIIAARHDDGWHVGRPDLPLVALVGTLDAAANALFAFALTQGVRPIVSVLGSLYPLTTVVLAQLVLHERLGVARSAGVLATLSGVTLVVVR